MLIFTSLYLARIGVTGFIQGNINWNEYKYTKIIGNCGTFRKTFSGIANLFFGNGNERFKIK